MLRAHERSCVGIIHKVVVGIQGTGAHLHLNHGSDGRHSPTRFFDIIAAGRGEQTGAEKKGAQM